MTYRYKSVDISTFLAGSSSQSNIEYTSLSRGFWYPPLSFPGTNNISDVDAFYDTDIIRPFPLPYFINEVSLHTLRFASYTDFIWVSDTQSTISVGFGQPGFIPTEQQINAPNGTTHISGVLISGGGGGGAGGGGNNPTNGGDTAGQPGGGGGSGAQAFFYRLPFSSPMQVVIGRGGNGGTCQYKTKGNTGYSGTASKLKSPYTNFVVANGGAGGNGGASGNANNDGEFVGTGGGGGNASGNLHNPSPTIPATTNRGIDGYSGTPYNGRISYGAGGNGGTLRKYLNTNTAYGTGGDGGTTDGRGSGAGANDSNAFSGTPGFCRIYFLIE